MTLNEFLVNRTLVSHPDDVRTTEYRAVYEMLESVCQSSSGPETLEMGDAALTELIGYAHEMRKTLRRRWAWEKRKARFGGV